MCLQYQGEKAMKLWITKTMVAVACVLGAGGAAAQQCVGFSDVDVSNAFCPGVEWIKNRGDHVRMRNAPGTAARFLLLPERQRDALNDGSVHAAVGESGDGGGD